MSELPLRSGVIAPRVFDAVPNRQPHDEVEDDDGDDPHEKKERFYPCDIHAPDHSRRWGSTSGNAARRALGLRGVRLAEHMLGPARTALAWDPRKVLDPIGGCWPREPVAGR